MNRFFNPNSEIWRAFSYAFDVFVLSVVWLLLSSLLLTSGLSTTGLYYAVNNYLIERKVNPLEGYAKSVVQNWKIAIVANLILALFGLLIAWSMWISYQMMISGVLIGRLVFFFGAVVAVFFIGYVSYVFPTLASYHYGLKALLNVSLKLSIMHLPYTILFALLYILSALFAYYFWISLFFMPVIVMLIQRKFLNKIFQSHTR